MDAIAPQSGRKIGAIIENDRHTVRLGHRGQGGHDGGYDLVRDIFQPDLQGCDITCAQGFCQDGRKSGEVVQPRRGDEVEAAIRNRHGR